MPVVSPGTQFSSTNKTDRHDITEILLKHHNPNPKPFHFHIMLVGFFMDHSWKIFTYLTLFPDNFISNGCLERFKHVFYFIG